VLQWLAAALVLLRQAVQPLPCCGRHGRAVAAPDLAAPHQAVAQRAASLSFNPRQHMHHWRAACSSSSGGAQRSSLGAAGAVVTQQQVQCHAA
jgi:hypothetical protein